MDDKNEDGYFSAIFLKSDTEAETQISGSGIWRSNEFCSFC